MVTETEIIFDDDLEAEYTLYMQGFIEELDLMEEEYEYRSNRG